MVLLICILFAACPRRLVSYHSTRPFRTFSGGTLAAIAVVMAKLPDLRVLQLRAILPERAMFKLLPPGLRVLEVFDAKSKARVKDLLARCPALNTLAFSKVLAGGKKEGGCVLLAHLPSRSSRELFVVTGNVCLITCVLSLQSSSLFSRISPSRISPSRLSPKRKSPRRLTPTFLPGPDLKERIGLLGRSGGVATDAVVANRHLQRSIAQPVEVPSPGLIGAPPFLHHGGRVLVHSGRRGHRDQGLVIINRCHFHPPQL